MHLVVQVSSMEHVNQEKVKYLEHETVKMLQYMAIPSLAFALAGICLMMCLMMLNLTVSTGTIKGLIFYANIVRANNAIFFPGQSANRFLSWFIAWLNFDLGIETCFYDGLTAYAKTWLRFVFPVYIWILVSAILISSHYSTRAAKICGNNAVQVLATLSSCPMQSFYESQLQCFNLHS